jgi:hypothetical protein
MNISGNRYYVVGNQISASFMDYVATIDVHFCKNGRMMWELIFSKGDGYNQKSYPIYCVSLEDAFNLIEHYSEQIKFDDLMKELYKDNNQPTI